MNSMNMLVWWTKISRPLFSLFDFYASKQARCVASYLEHLSLDRTQWTTQEVLTQLQLEKLKKILREASYLPFWKDRCDKDSVLYREIVSLEEVTELPILTREDIRKYFPHHLVNPNLPRRRYYKEHTSGSTGEALVFYEDTITIPTRIARYRRQRVWIEHTSRSTLMRMMNRERLGFWNEGHCLMVRSGEEFDDALTRMYSEIEAESRKHPVFLEAISSYILRLAQLIEEHNLNRLFVTGLLTFGESLAPKEVAFVENIFSTKMFSRYSLREFSTIAQECRYSSRNIFHVIAEHFYVEIVDEDGCVVSHDTTGRVIVTSLENMVMPFIRYDTGDRGRLLAQKCLCGCVLPLLVIEGRELSSIRLRTGNVVSLKDMISTLASHMYNAGQFQLVHKKSDHFVLRLVLFERYNTSTFLERLKKSLSDVIGKGVAVDAQIVSSIPLSKGGKRVLFVSEM